MEPQSNFMFLSIANEVLGLSPEETLNSDFVLISSILRERNYISNLRNKEESFGKDDLKEDEEWITMTDFATGQPKKVKRVKSI